MSRIHDLQQGLEEIQQIRRNYHDYNVTELRRICADNGLPTGDLGYSSTSGARDYSPDELLYVVIRHQLEEALITNLRIYVASRVSNSPDSIVADIYGLGRGGPGPLLDLFLRLEDDINNQIHVEQLLTPEERETRERERERERRRERERWRVRDR